MPTTKKPIKQQVRRDYGKATLKVKGKQIIQNAPKDQPKARLKRQQVIQNAPKNQPKARPIKQR